MMKRAGINGLIQSGAQKHRIDPTGFSMAARRGILLSSKDGLVWSETRPLRHCRHSAHLRNTHSFAPSSPSPLRTLSCIIPPFRSRGEPSRGPSLAAALWVSAHGWPGPGPWSQQLLLCGDLLQAAVAARAQMHSRLFY